MPLRAGWLVTAFAGAMLIPACALGWLSVRFLEQDAQLRETQMRERQELAADRAVAQLEQAVAASERLLNRPEGFGEDDAAIVSVEDSRLRVFAGKKLLFTPVEFENWGNTRIFDHGERLEFQREELAAAMEEYRSLTKRGEAAVRAEAWLRLARTLQKMGRGKEAVAAWSALGRHTGVRINGVPADLVAARASGWKKVVAEGLAEGRWEIDEATFRRYADEAGFEPDAKRVALASAAAWARSQLGQAKARVTKEFAGRRMVILSMGSKALVAGPDFQERWWLSGVDPSQVMVGGEWGADAALRTAAATGLPWNVAVRRTSAPEHEGRRGMILTGIGLLTMAVLATMILLVVVLSKELAVARLKSDFVAAVSHEFRTPLTTLRQYNEMLLEEDGLTAMEQHDYLMVQKRATERLQRLVESLLDFRRMEGRGWAHRMHVLDVERLVGDVVAEFRREAEGRNFAIECRTLRAQVEGDEEALGRALWNLLDNAVKYSDQSRAIEVGMDRENGHVRVSVRDHGSGIAKQDQKRIFESFVRTEDSRRKGIQGTGIGLALVRQIAAAHGGRVELTSEPAEGSTFTLVLPLKEAMCSES